MTRVICFVNEKGGSGKTTLTVNVGAHLARTGSRTLILDMDPQGHAGKSLGLDTRRYRPSVIDLLLDPAVAVEDVAVKSNEPNLWVAAANKLLTDFTVNVSSHHDRVFKLHKKLGGADSFDFILIDSPPSLGLTTINILVASTEVVIPVSLTYLALDGCAEICETINMVKENFGHGSLRISLVAPTFYRDTVLVNSILDKLRRRFGPKVARTVIHYDMKLDQAQSFGKSIFEFAPESLGARQMAQVAEEVRAAINR